MRIHHLACYCPLYTVEISLNIIPRDFFQGNPPQQRKLSRIVCIPLTVAVGTSQLPWDQMERDAEVTTNYVPYLKAVDYYEYLHKLTLVSYANQWTKICCSGKAYPFGKTKSFDRFSYLLNSKFPRAYLKLRWWYCNECFFTLSLFLVPNS